MLSICYLILPLILVVNVACQPRSYSAHILKGTLYDRSGNTYDVAAVRIPREGLSRREIELGAALRGITLVDSDGKVVLYKQLAQPVRTTLRGVVEYGPLFSEKGAALGGRGLMDSHPDLPVADALRFRLSAAELRNLVK